MEPLNPQPPPNDRSQQRTPSPIESKVAPYRFGKALGDLQFEAVTLNDLSAGGFSFWTSHWPKFAELVFPLAEPQAGLVLAHVRKVERIKGRYLVRCQFVRRLSDEKP